jgi:hypothetical protein
MKQTNIFKVGDCVEWESSFTKKQGVIVAVIPAGIQFYNYPLRCFIGKTYEQFAKYSKSKLSDGKKRNHVSYLVLVDNHYLYWPRVGQLKGVKHEQRI